MLITCSYTAAPSQNWFVIAFPFLIESALGYAINSEITSKELKFGFYSLWGHLKENGVVTHHTIFFKSSAFLESSPKGFLEEFS